MTGNEPGRRDAAFAAPLSYARQFITGASGEAFSQFVTIVTQLVMIPALLLIWGPDRLGIWLIISAVPTYLTLGDLGLTSIFGNEITARRLAGDSHGVEVAIHSSWYTTRIITLSALALSFVLTLTAPAFLPAVSGISPTDGQLALLLLCLCVCVTLAQGTVAAGMRVMGLSGAMSGALAAARLAESVVLLAVAILSQSMALAAFAMLLSRTVVLLSTRAIFLKRNAAFRPHTHLANRKLIWRLMPASAGYFSFTFGHAALIQLPIIIIGNLLSPSAVVVFTAARTLSRMGRTLVSIVNHAIDPIFTQLAGARAPSLQQTAKLHRRGVFWFSALFFAVAALVGPGFLAWWTHGVTVGHETVFLVMLAAAALEVVWFTLQVPYIATNQHYVFGWVFFALTITSATALFFVLPSFGLMGAAFSILACHLAFVTYTLVRIRTHPIRLEPTKL